LEPQQLEPLESPLQIELEERDLVQLEPEPFELELELELESDSDSQPVRDNNNENHNAELPPAELGVSIELVTPNESAASLDWSVLEPATSRRRPKESSGIRKLLPPILGGFAAFPIAIFILWYGFGKDIGTTGPTVAKYVPWIVPEKFRNMPLAISPPNTASGRSQRSAPSGRNTLPTLNRDEATESPKNTSDATSPVFATEKPIVEPEQPSPSPQPKTPSVSESTAAKILETIEALKLIIEEMENSQEDKKVKAKIFVDCQSKLKELSKLASELTGPSARIWNQQLESIARKVLSAPVIPSAMKLLANNARAEIPASASGDFVATVIEVGEANMPVLNESWRLRETWPSDKIEIPIEVLPAAWRSGSATLPATCLVLGRLLPKQEADVDTSNNRQPNSSLVLKVHMLVPKQ
jgi:hypothetical protein